MAKTTKQAAPATNKPIREYKSGNIKVVCWLNTTANGEFYSVTISRSYKTSDGQWRDVNSFNSSDLLTVSRLTEFAWHFIDGLKNS